MVAIVAASSTYAVAASTELTETATPARIQASGLTVVDVAYEPDPDAPDRVVALRLRLASPADAAVLATLDGGRTWIACRPRGGGLHCPTRALRLHVQDAAALAIAPRL